MSKFFNKNCCDGIYNSFDIHFTGACDNRCSHCVDSKYQGIGVNKPDVESIIKTVIENQSGYDDVLFLGGEPLLFIDELLETIKQIKRKTDLKVFVTSAMPKICKDRYETFIEILSLVDGFNISAQHHNESIADEIRKTKSKYDRQEFYSSLPMKEKIRINLNIVKPYLYTKEDITKCLLHYDKMGFNSIKLSEIQHGKEFFVSFEEVFGVNYGSPYSSGCQKYIDTNLILPDMKTPVLLKRSCFMCESTLKASVLDGVKVLYKVFNKPENKYAVVYGNGKLSKGWV